LIIPYYNQPDKITLSFLTARGSIYVQSQQIVWIQAMSNYCKIFFADGSTLVVAKVLAWFQEHLGDDFRRIHRSHLVNRHHITSLKINQYPKVVLSTGKVLVIAKRKKEVVRVLMAG